MKNFNVKKCEILQEKKRNPNSFNHDDSKKMCKKKKRNLSYDKRIELLKKELLKYHRDVDIEPALYLTHSGQNAVVNFLSNNKCMFISPLFVEDIYHVLMHSLLGNVSQFSLRWAHLKCPREIMKTVLMEIGGLSKKDVLDMNSELKENSRLFPFVLRMVSSNIPFATELSTLHLASDFYSHPIDNYASLFPIERSTQDIVHKSCKQNSTVSKVYLLLNPIQLAMHSYPLSQSVFVHSKSDNYVFTKQRYSCVTANSPMFALDCEMCQIVSGKLAVTRIGIVNENLETVYHAFVKPDLEILNYNTQYSGITEQMLENVTTTLNDVQADIQKLLPSDAILCGQSLNCDLHALKMIHPYVIDTSVIFNDSGVRQRKISLKELTKIYLKESIQENITGHNPIEDSIATMKLVQLKLKKLCTDQPVISQNKNVSDGLNSSENINTSCFVKLNSYSQQGFFAKISKFSKKICIIGNRNSLKDYPDMSFDNVTKVEKSNLKEIFETTSNSLENFNLIISHLTLNAKTHSIIEINNILKGMYGNFPDKTLFIIALSATETSKDDYFKHGYCMFALKKSTM